MPNKCQDVLHKLSQSLQSTQVLTESNMELWQISVQVGWNGGSLVLAKIGSRSMHSITLVGQEWLFILSCINTNRQILATFLHIQKEAILSKLHWTLWI